MLHRVSIDELLARGSRIAAGNSKGFLKACFSIIRRMYDLILLIDPLLAIA